MSTPTRPHLQRIINLASTAGATRAAIAFPCSESSIEATMTAQRMGLIEPIMVGPRRRIESIAADKGLDFGRMEFIDSGDDPNAAA